MAAIDATPADPSLVVHPKDASPRRVESRDPEFFGVPTGREEDWKFSPLARLTALLDPANSDIPAGRLVVDADAPEEVDLEAIPMTDPVCGSTFTPADRVSALAFAGVEQAILVRIPKETIATDPVWLTLGGEPGRAYAHVVVDVEPFASALVVLDHVGDVQLAANTEFRVGDGASLTVISVQDWAPGAVHVETQSALLGRDARFAHTAVTLGGDVVRLSVNVRYAGQGAEADVAGMFFTDAGQHHEHRLFVDHAVSNCRSNVVYKGALQGDGAHSVWIGDVFIRANTVGTNTYESNRNLVLTDGARADSVPNLEIETGEVGTAGHASATGRFDDQQLFYLMARGIPESEARQLIVRGFFTELLDRIQVPELRSRIEQAIDDELAAATHTEGDAALVDTRDEE